MVFRKQISFVMRLICSVKQIFDSSTSSTSHLDSRTLNAYHKHNKRTKGKKQVTLICNIDYNKCSTALVLVIYKLYNVESDYIVCPTVAYGPK